jgi:plastocyanin
VKLLAAVMVAALALVPAADARKHHRKRHRVRGNVVASHAKAPESWSHFAAPSAAPATAPAPAAPRPTPTATPTSAPAAPAAGSPAATPTPAPAPAPSATPTPGSSLPAPNPHSVSVGSVEYSFTLSQRSVEAGDVQIQFDNSRAEDAHQLAIDGVGGDGVNDYWSFDEEPAGSVTRHTLRLRPGSYVLFCPLPDHEARGMRATLVVR